MDIVLVVCGIAVMFVLLVAGLAKWGEPQAGADALRAFGVPDPWARQAGAVLPALELASAAALLLPRLAWGGALIAAMLLGGATLAVCAALLAGHRPRCQCFGQTSAAPISWATAIRNGLLTACAGALLLGGEAALEQGLAVAAWRAIETVGALALAWSVTACLAASLLGLLFSLARQQGRLLLSIDNLTLRLDAAGIPPAGQGAAVPLAGDGGSSAPPCSAPPCSAPPFTSTTLAGATVASSTLLGQGRELLLLFVSPDCAPCKDVLEALHAWRSGSADGKSDAAARSWLHAGKLVIVSSGTAPANRRKLGALLSADTLLQAEQEISTLFGVIATPSAVRIDGDGRIAAPPAIGRDQIMALLAMPPEAAAHQPAPLTGAAYP